jgi:hypothetical protein
MVLLMTNPDNSKKITVFDRCGSLGTPTPTHSPCRMPTDRNQASWRVTAAKAMATNAAASARKMAVSIDWNAQ